MNLSVYFGIVVWLLVSGVIQSPIEAQSRKDVPIKIDWSQNGSRFAITTRERLTIYDAALNPIASMKFPDDIDYETPLIALSPNGERIYIGNPTDRKILDSTTLDVLLDLNKASILYLSPEWNREGTAIAFRKGNDQGVSIYSAINGSLLRSFSSPVIWRVGYDCEGEGWSPNNLYFARAAQDSIYILDALTGEEVHKYQLIGEYLGCPIWSPDSTRLAITSSVSVELNSPNSHPDPGSPGNARRESVIVINAADGTVISTVTGLRDGVSLTWSPDGHQLAGHDNFRSLYIWNPDTGALIDSYLLPPYSVEILKYSPFGGRLMTGFNTTRSTARRPDSNFIPKSTFAQSVLDGAIQFVAHAASPDKLQEILTQCVTDQDTKSKGNTLLAGSQYMAFTHWINQLPSDVMPTACAADLQLITQAIVSVKSPQ